MVPDLPRSQQFKRSTYQLQPWPKLKNQQRGRDMYSSPHEAWPSKEAAKKVEVFEPVNHETEVSTLRASATSAISSQTAKTSVTTVASNSSGGSIPVNPQTYAVRSPAAKKARPRVSAWSRFKRLCGYIAENKIFVLFGTLITIYALTGDDVKMSLTNKPADPVFDGMVIFCMIFFSSEIVIGCLGKDDYFMGFFFILDVISTLTLLLDLSMVAEALFGSSDADPSKARSSKTARVGAKMGRLVRVLRLIRIVKLFKVASTVKKNDQEKKPVLADDFDENEDDEEEDDLSKESVVGKKLSDKMTQRTIVLVLSMLLIIPLLKVDETEQMPNSGAYGAEAVLEAYRRTATDSSFRSDYDSAVLTMVYYHNWFNRRAGKCPVDTGGCSADFFSNQFWLGIASQGSKGDLQKTASSTSLNASAVYAWNSAQTNQKRLYNYGTLPDQALQTLAGAWDQECDISGHKHLGISLLGIPIPDRVDFAVKCPTELRFNEVERSTPRLMSSKEFEDWYFVFYTDLRPLTRTEATMSMATTAFICVILCIASIFFTSTANTLVLGPVEKMVKKVEAIRDNPLAAMKMADDEFRREEVAKKIKRKQAERTCGDPRNLCAKGESELMETVILEKTIIKLGSLLALGFGEAGANIVSSNMSGSGSAGVNAMVDGNRIDCIVGVARIMNFSTATEVLQGKVMTFFNQIAEIVHGVVDECRGAVNKNDGDTFLIVWRTAGLTAEEVQKTGELSILAFALVVAHIQRSPLLATYRTHPGLQQRLKERCFVNLSFGLHYGWAIEGAVGSEFKIDASYISPNVSIAASVERATKIYGVGILVSQSVMELCSKPMRHLLRLVDKVVIKGSQVPLELCCLDLDFKSLKVDELERLNIAWNSFYRFKSRHHNEVEKNRLWTEEKSMVDFLTNNSDFKTMRREYSEEFMQKFKMGYQSYSQGEWRVAQTTLMKTHKMLREEDGPSKALLRIMEAHNFQAPEKWRGFHPLELMY